MRFIKNLWKKIGKNFEEKLRQNYASCLAVLHLSFVADRGCVGRIQCTDMDEEIRDNLDNREWSQKHLEAAGRLPKPSIGALTPPQLDHVDGRDVDVRGPDGFTPLMIASLQCGSRRSKRQSAAGPDSDSTGSTDLDADDTAAIISDLINQGAAVNATTDRTGECRQTAIPVELGKA